VPIPGPAPGPAPVPGPIDPITGKPTTPLPPIVDDYSNPVLTGLADPGPYLDKYAYVPPLGSSMTSPLVQPATWKGSSFFPEIGGAVAPVIAPAPTTTGSKGV
jgi:hypothetical protein